MNRNTALEMAEALSVDNELSIGSLGDDADDVVVELWLELESVRDENIKLALDCRRIRDELDCSNGVIR